MLRSGFTGVASQALLYDVFFVPSNMFYLRFFAKTDFAHVLIQTLQIQNIMLRSTVHILNRFCEC